MTGTATNKKAIAATEAPNFIFILIATLSLFNFIARSSPGNVASGGADLVVFKTDEFHQVEVRAQQLRRKFQVDCLGKGSGIVEREVVDERSVINARPPFDGVKLIGVRRPAAIEPELLVIADSV